MLEGGEVLGARLKYDFFSGTYGFQYTSNIKAARWRWDASLKNSSVGADFPIAPGLSFGFRADLNKVVEKFSWRNKECSYC